MRPRHVVGPPTDAPAAEDSARARACTEEDGGHERKWQQQTFAFSTVTRKFKIFSLLTSNCSSAQYIAPQMDGTRSEPSLFDNSTWTGSATSDGTCCQRTLLALAPVSRPSPRRLPRSAPFFLHRRFDRVVSAASKVSAGSASSASSSRPSMRSSVSGLPPTICATHTMRQRNHPPTTRKHISAIPAQPPKTSPGTSQEFDGGDGALALHP